MGLDFVKRDKVPSTNGVKPLYHSRRGVKLFLPPSYQLNATQWEALIELYNQSGRQVTLAHMFSEYLKEFDKSLDTSDLLSVSEIRIEDGQAIADLSFKNTKPGLRALVWLEADGPQLVPILESGGQSIRRLSLSYVA